jgi:hypothetical protein
MILDFILSDGEFAMSEFRDLEDLALLMFGMMYLLLLLLFWLLWFVIVCGPAMIIRYAHVHVTGVFTGAGAISGHTTGPAHAITGGGSIRVLQGFVFDVGVGV